MKSGKVLKKKSAKQNASKDVNPGYVDGFVLPVLKKHLKKYQKVARVAGKVWMEHGALSYRESVGSDLNIKSMKTHFPKMAKAKAGETVIFAWITYKSEKHRGQVNAKVMKDPRILALGEAEQLFDFNRMAYGGFKLIVVY